jgi:hypothetical protein
VIHPDQLAWLKEELAAAPSNRALILALHRPVFSAYGPHPGSLALKTTVEEAFKEAKRTPDLILTAHVHDYQRFTGYFNGKAVPSILAGAGGYNQQLHRLDRKLFQPGGVPYKYDSGPEILEKFNDFQHGSLIVDVRTDRILVSYLAVDDPTAGDPVPTKPAAAYDTLEIKI